MKRLTVTEYEPIAIGAQFASYPKTLTQAQADALIRYGEGRRLQLLEYVNSRQVRAKNYVGIVALNGAILEVLPKIENATEVSAIRHNLLVMLGTALGLDIRESELTNLAKRSGTPLDFIVILYCRHLLLLARQGLVKSYVEAEDDLPVLRGKLLATRQVIRNAVHPERLACRYSVFSENNLLNQTLKAALLRVRWLIQDFDAQRLASEILFLLADVTDDVDVEAAQRLVLDRTNVRYAPVLQLAQLILRGETPDVVRGSAVSYALLFDMNDLFERYIGATMRRVARGTRLRVRVQARGFYLAREMTTPRNAFALIPDIVVSHGNIILGVLDTKWKRLVDGVERLGVVPGDMYQMAAYAQGLSCSRVVLLYPHHAGLEREAGRLLNYRLKPDGVIQVAIETINMSDISKVPEQCRRIFERIGALSNDHLVH